MSNKEPFI